MTFALYRICRYESPDLICRVFPWLLTFIFHIPGIKLWKVTIQDFASFRVMVVVVEPFYEH
jgi:hypothetical protein